jgi:hypothetical protein
VLSDKQVAELNALGASARPRRFWASVLEEHLLPRSGANRLVFDWQTRRSVPAAPLDARWIFREASGPSGSGRIIATALSSPSQLDGRFTLSKPANGFPPDDYRLELRVGEEIVHREEFHVGTPR